MRSNITPNQADYRVWLGELKSRFWQVQLKAAVAVNTAIFASGIRSMQPHPQLANSLLTN